MRPKALLFCGFLLPFLAGCSEPGSVEPSHEKGAYFDVPGLVREQVAVLNQQQPAFKKTVWVNSQKPETQQLQQVDWNEELQHFLEIDLNKKALAGGYTVTEENSEAGKRTLYRRNPDVSAPIQLLEVVHDQQNQVRKLRAISEEKNALFFSREERVFQLNNNNRLQNYQVSGVQKVLLFDSLRYSAQAERATLLP